MGEQHISATVPRDRTDEQVLITFQFRFLLCFPFTLFFSTLNHVFFSMILVSYFTLQFSSYLNLRDYCSVFIPLLVLLFKRSVLVPLPALVYKRSVCLNKIRITSQDLITLLIVNYELYKRSVIDHHRTRDLSAKKKKKQFCVSIFGMMIDRFLAGNLGFEERCTTSEMPEKGKPKILSF